jgi:hypothetical protein
MLEDRGQEECIQRHCTDEKQRRQLSLGLYQRKLWTSIKTLLILLLAPYAGKQPTRYNGLDG